LSSIHDIRNETFERFFPTGQLIRRVVFPLDTESVPLPEHHFLTSIEDLDRNRNLYQPPRDGYAAGLILRKGKLLIRLIGCYCSPHHGIGLFFRCRAEAQPPFHRFTHRLRNLHSQSRLAGLIIERQNRNRSDMWRKPPACKTIQAAYLGKRDRDASDFPKSQDQSMQVSQRW